MKSVIKAETIGYEQHRSCVNMEKMERIFASLLCVLGNSFIILACHGRDEMKDFFVHIETAFKGISPSLQRGEARVPRARERARYLTFIMLNLRYNEGERYSPVPSRFSPDTRFCETRGTNTTTPLSSGGFFIKSALLPLRVFRYFAEPPARTQPSFSKVSHLNQIRVAHISRLLYHVTLYISPRGGDIIYYIYSQPKNTHAPLIIITPDVLLPTRSRR